MFERKYGWSDLDTLCVAGNLAATYLSQGKNDEAEALARNLLFHRNRVLGKNSPQALDTEGALARIYHRKGDFKEAAEIRERILAFAVLRQEDPVTRAAAYAAYGSTLREQGMLDEAERHILQAVELSTNAIGSTHPWTLAHRSDLANLYSIRGNFSSACVIGGEVLKAREESLGTEHDVTIGSMSDQATNLLLADDREKSQALIEQAVGLARRHLGVRDPTRFSVFSNAAAIYGELGFDQLARELSFESFDSSRREREARTARKR